MATRIGIYFLFVGMLTLIIYVATDIAGTPSFVWFFTGLLLVILGVYFIRKNWARDKKNKNN